MGRILRESHYRYSTGEVVMVVFEFEVQAYKRVQVDGFSKDAKEAARIWLINHLEEECHDIINSSTYVSDGKVLS